MVSRQFYLAVLLLTQVMTMCAVNNISPQAQHNLEDFQNFGNTDSLLKFIEQSGRDRQGYQDAIGSLSPIFEALSFGEQPRYEDLNLEAISRQRAEVEDIVRWMAGSQKADMKTSAIELMGILGWETFRSDLEKSLASQHKWERLTAIKALGQITNDWAIESLTHLSKDADPEIQQAAQRALKSGD